jgi:hypothetical protein
MIRITSFTFATFVTVTAIVMSAVAALDRGSTAVDKTLLIAISVAICTGSHLIPSISKTKLAWLLWVLCMVGAVYSHITFFSFAKLRANDERSQYSIQRSGVEREIEVTRLALERIEARPVATVASELAVTKGWSRRNALEEELTEARRATMLQAELIKLTSKATEAEVTGSEDIVTSRIAKVTGSNQDSIELVIASTFSILIELLGAFLWREVLTRKEESPALESPMKSDANSHVDLENAIATGIVKPTVKGIRTFLGCSQTKAMEFRRIYNLQRGKT